MATKKEKELAAALAETRQELAAARDETRQELEAAIKAVETAAADREASLRATVTQQTARAVAAEAALEQRTAPAAGTRHTVSRTFPYLLASGAPIVLYGGGETVEAAEKELELELEKLRAAIG